MSQRACFGREGMFKHNNFIIWEIADVLFSATKSSVLQFGSVFFFILLLGLLSQHDALQLCGIM